MALVISGVIVLVLGIILADVVIDTATTALTNPSIGSFAGAAAIGGLIPFIYFTVVILLAVGMMGIGARGMLVVALPVVVPVLQVAGPGLVPGTTPVPGAAFLAVLLAVAAVQGWCCIAERRRENSDRPGLAKHPPRGVF
jgi:hypothetical protein